MKQYTEEDIKAAVTKDTPMSCYLYDPATNSYEKITIIKAMKTLFHFLNRYSCRCTLNYGAIVCDLEFAKRIQSRRIRISYIRKWCGSSILTELTDKQLGQIAEIFESVVKQEEAKRRMENTYDD